MIAYSLAAVFFVVLGTAYVKGYDLVKEKSPQYLPQFYLIMTTIRIILVLTVIGLYVLFTENREDAIHFALACIGMYVVMMVITLILRH